MAEPVASKRRYQHLVALASGGMGRVTVARRVGDPAGAVVALKTLHEHLSNDSEFAKRFAYEAEIGVLVNHPCVVRMLESGRQDGLPYIAMEYFPSEMLAALMTRVARNKTRIPLPIVLKILADALAGLHAVHEALGPDGAPLGLVHRDFSPQNVLVGESGATRLADLGIAKAPRSAALTRVGVVRGKSGYLSPEQSLGRPLDRRSDIFSAGIVLYEVVTGRPLFHARSEHDALEKLLKGTVPDPREHAPDCPPALAALIQRALSRDPAARPPTADAMRTEICAVAEALGTPAGEPDVARFVEELSGDRLRARQRALDEALAKPAQADEHAKPPPEPLLVAKRPRARPEAAGHDEDDGDDEGEGEGATALPLWVGITLFAVASGAAVGWWLMR